MSRFLLTLFLLAWANLSFGVIIIQSDAGGGGGSLTMTTLRTEQNTRLGTAFTPASNSLLLVISCSGVAAADNGITNDGGLTFSVADRNNLGAYRSEATAWYAEVATSPGSMEVDLTGTSSGSYDWMVIQFEGYDTSDPVGLTMTDGAGGVGRSGAYSGSMGGTTASNSIVVGCFVSNSSGLADMSSDASWTELAEDGSNYDSHFTYIEGAVSNFQMSDATASGNYQGWAVIAVEIKAN